MPGLCLFVLVTLGFELLAPFMLGNFASTFLLDITHNVSPWAYITGCVLCRYTIVLHGIISITSDPESSKNLMDTHAIDILEYPKVLEQIVNYAHSTPVREHIRSMLPFERIAAIESRQALLRQLRAVQRQEVDLPVLAHEDLGGILKKVRPEGAVLANELLCICQKTLRCAGEIAAFLERSECSVHSELLRLRGQLDPMPRLLGQMQRTFDEDGQIKDTASPELARVRATIRSHEAEIRRRLNRILSDQDISEALQEQYVTLRNRRYVIPVRREAKSRISGVVHDHSDSGRTLFIEPSSILPLGNELSDLHADEEDECRRIRAALSREVRDSIPELEQNQRVLTAFAAAVAVLRWSDEYDCILPEFGSRLSIRGARHPLLMQQLASEKQGKAVVPLDFTVDEGCRALVITGSNSGGKTVAMKTAGLSVLLAQTGLPVPVHEESSFVLFDRVYADIGDEQSLTENLSTFTGHLRRIADIFRRFERSDAGRALVLLDELGTGTDPLEGGALACAVLERLADTNTLTIATTHLGVVKTFVHEHPAMQNASVRFNAQTLEPEFVLDLGRPGASHALSIAARMGVPEGLLETAKSFMGRDQFRIEQLLNDLEENRRQAEEQERAAQQRLLEASKDREKLSAELAEVRRERRQMLHEAYEEAGRIVADARRRTEQVIAEIREAGGDVRATAGASRKKMEEQAEKIDEKRRQTRAVPRAPIEPSRLLSGAEVWVEKLQANATVRSVSNDGRKARVVLGALEFEVATEEIGKPDLSHEGTDAGKPRLRETRPKLDKKVATELNLIGCRVAEAIPRLEHFIDEATLAGLEEIRVIHGFGTGQLQRGVHEYLRGAEAVEDFHLGDPGKTPGGNGVTLVRLR